MARILTTTGWVEGSVNFSKKASSKAGTVCSDWPAQHLSSSQKTGIWPCRSANSWANDGTPAVVICVVQISNAWTNLSKRTFYSEGNIDSPSISMALNGAVPPSVLGFREHLPSNAPPLTEPLSYQDGLESTTEPARIQSYRRRAILIRPP